MINFVHGPRDFAGAVISAYCTVSLTVSYRVSRIAATTSSFGCRLVCPIDDCSGDSALRRLDWAIHVNFYVDRQGQ